MIKVEFLGPIGLEDIEIEAATLSEAAKELQKIEGLQKWLQNSAVAVNDALVADKNIALKNGDKISILPPVCGG